MRIVKSITFDAAHYLPRAGAGQPPPYERLHGHSFTLEVAVEGAVDPAAGWVADFAAVAAAMESVRERLDHHLLNAVDGLERPTLENICRWAARELAPSLPGLVEVRIARPSNGEACIFTLAPEDRA